MQIATRLMRFSGVHIKHLSLRGVINFTFDEGVTRTGNTSVLLTREFLPGREKKMYPNPSKPSHAQIVKSSTFEMMAQTKHVSIEPMRFLTELKRTFKITKYSS